MPESNRTRLMRWYFNLFPAYRGTGGRVTYISADWHEIRVKLPLSWRTRNYVGTTFGGSLYGVVDPMFMIMLIHILGGEYTVWDKAASIQFKRPGRSTLYATFRLELAEIEQIKEALKQQPSLDRDYHIDLVDKAGAVHAAVDKTIYIRRNSK